MRFKVGDRVEAIVDHPSRSAYIYAGDSGTVREVYDSIDAGVEWDNKFPDGHSCSGHCKEGYGWYVRQREIRPEARISCDIDETSFLTIALCME